jgi:hypothetical protein
MFRTQSEYDKYYILRFVDTRQLLIGWTVCGCNSVFNWIDSICLLLCRVLLGCERTFYFYLQECQAPKKDNSPGLHL